MGRKVVIVGGVAGGASTAARLRRMDEDAEIVIFERGDYISFANCGLPYHIGRVIEDRESLLIQTPEAMEARFNISVKVKHQVVGINRKKKEILVKNLENDDIFRESYNYLILSPGAEPVKPPLEGVDRPNVFTLRNIPDTDRIKSFIFNNRPEKAVVVGGGFIGLEMAENLHQLGINVSLVEMADQVLAPIDYEMAAMVHNHLRTQCINLYLKDGISGIEEDDQKSKVVLQSGRKLYTDMIILSIGVRPNSELARQAGLEIGETGGIKVNRYLQTSDENIFAIGDAIEVTDFITDEPVLIPLAGPANKQGRIAADNLIGRREEYKGTQGTSIAKVFDLAVASTGSNEKRLMKAGIDYQVSYTVSNNHAGYYPGALPMTIKILFTPNQGRLLGAQIIGHKGVDKRIDLLAAAVRSGQTVFDLQELELAYAPPFGSAKDPVNMAGYAAGNILKGVVDVIHWNELDKIGDDVIFLDVREKVETRIGVIDGAVNIPLNSLRERFDELDKNKEIVVYCAVGLRGYIGCRILMQNGFNRVKNLSGGFKLYSAVQDDRAQIIERPGQDELTSASNPEEGRIVGKKFF